MRVRVGYAYEATSDTASGQRKVVLKEEALLHVQPVEPSSAKVALRCRGFHALHGNRHKFDQVIRPDDTTSRVPVVSSGGKLYEPVRIFTDYPERTERLATSADLESPERFLSDVKWVTKLVLLQEEGKKPRTPNPKTSKVTYSRNEAPDAAADLGGVAKDFILVGDVLHRRIEEPLFRIDKDGGLAVVQCPRYFNEGVTYFRLDETDALERTMALLQGEAGASRAREMADKIEVEPTFRPVADIARDCLMKGVEALLWRAGRMLPKLPIPAMEAFADLDEAYGKLRYDRVRQSAGVGRMRDLATGLCDAMEAAGNDGTAGGLARIQVEVFDARGGSDGRGYDPDVESLAAMAF